MLKYTDEVGKYEFIQYFLTDMGSNDLSSYWLVRRILIAQILRVKPVLKEIISEIKTFHGGKIIPSLEDFKRRTKSIFWSNR